MAEYIAEQLEAAGKGSMSAEDILRRAEEEVGDDAGYSTEGTDAVVISHLYRMYPDEVRGWEDVGMAEDKYDYDYAAEGDREAQAAADAKNKAARDAAHKRMGGGDRPQDRGQASQRGRDYRSDALIPIKRHINRAMDATEMFGEEDKLDTERKGPEIKKLSAKKKDKAKHEAKGKKPKAKRQKKEPRRERYENPFDASQDPKYDWPEDEPKDPGSKRYSGPGVEDPGSERYSGPGVPPEDHPNPWEGWGPEREPPPPESMVEEPPAPKKKPPIGFIKDRELSMSKAEKAGAREKRRLSR
ncbi:serine/arginine repetitive matrix protein 1 [uncultured Mediterranean phage]|nr:serine/arginine repetitive matrix protein 1 [uncultured Mediterranean phage]